MRLGSSESDEGEGGEGSRELHLVYLVLRLSNDLSLRV
jgi:hypothetical protein